MLGLGSGISKSPTSGATIVTDNLVLRHGYALNPVHQVSTGAAFFVRGDTDYIDLDAHVGDVSSLTTGTLSVWFRTSTTGYWQEILTASDKSDAASDVTFGIKSDDKVFLFVREDGVTLCDVYSASTYTDGLWHHAVITQDDTTLKMYIDGVLEADTDTSSKWFSDATALDTLRIGVREDSGGNEYPFDGYLCNIGVWSAALTQAQIKSIMWKKYSDLTSSETTSLVSWWNLDSVIPNFTATTVYDNHGGEVVGSEEATNGDFALTSSWGSDQSINIVTQQLTKTGAGLSAQSGVITEGIPYVIVVDVASLDGATHVYVGGTSYSLSVGVQTIYAIGGSSNDILGFNNGYSTSTGSVINGNTGTLS